MGTNPRQAHSRDSPYQQDGLEATGSGYKVPLRPHDDVISLDPPPIPPRALWTVDNDTNRRPPEFTDPQIEGRSCLGLSESHSTRDSPTPFIVGGPTEDVHQSGPNNSGDSERRNAAEWCDGRMQGGSWQQMQYDSGQVMPDLNFERKSGDCVPNTSRNYPFSLQSDGDNSQLDRSHADVLVPVQPINVIKQLLMSVRTVPDQNIARQVLSDVTGPTPKTVGQMSPSVRQTTEQLINANVPTLGESS